jgi:hypothetical protein
LATLNSPFTVLFNNVERDLPGKKRVRLKKMLFCKALAPPIICTNFSSWMRVLEVSPECVAYTKAIKGIFNCVESLFTHWEKRYEEGENSPFNRRVLDQLSTITKAYAKLYKA